MSKVILTHKSLTLILSPMNGQRIKKKNKSAKNHVKVI